MARIKGGKSEQSAAHPKGWPGIPGRSQEHERMPEGTSREAGASDVTEAQRTLEREQHRREPEQKH